MQHDIHVRQYRYLFDGLLMFCRPQKPFGHYGLSGNYRPALCRQLLSKMGVQISN